MITDEQKARLSSEQLKVAEWWEERNNAAASLLLKMVNDASITEMSEEYKAYYSVYFCPHEHPLVEDCIACDDVFRLLYPERVCPNCDSLQDPDEMIPSRLCSNCRNP